MPECDAADRKQDAEVTHWLESQHPRHRTQNDLLTKTADGLTNPSATESSNIQAPMNFQNSNTKLRFMFSDELKLGSSLDVGAWFLELPACLLPPSHGATRN